MNKLLYTRNDIRPVLIDMKIPSRRLLYLYLASLERYRDSEGKLHIVFDENYIFELTVKEYAEQCGGLDWSTAYKQLIGAVRELRGYVIEHHHIYKKDRSPKLPNDWVELFTIAMSGTGYSEGEGYITLKLDKLMQPFISNFDKQFTKQYLNSALTIGEPNANKLYLILREWISSGSGHSKTILFDELKEALNLENKKSYASYKFFNSLYFQPAINKLLPDKNGQHRTEFLNINIEIIKRRGRKAHILKISWETNDSNKSEVLQDK